MVSGPETSGERAWPFADPADGLERVLIGAGAETWLRLRAPGLPPGPAQERLAARIAKLDAALPAGVLATRTGPGGALEVAWGQRQPLADAVAAAEERGHSPDAIAHGVIAACAGAGRALTALAAGGLSAGGLSPHQLAVGPDGVVALEVTSGWLAATRREALKLSMERLYSAVDDGVLLLELALSLMSGGAPWAELVAHVLDRGRLLEPEARRGGPRVIARVFDELCGVDEPAEQAALVRAAFPVATT